ncbi:unnamed protein product [Mytilus edulis]|uniref:Reverse transcriptase domain-containing protein n=1 Tax=Mytilus edulis TaxID=6550 RepID=A0A8S3QJ04_MYTED|nr:unnamed protein product [Mytilus edulis]
MLILKSYAKNKCNWQAVYADVLKDLQKLPDRAKALYSEAKFDKIRRRMSDQISKLVTKDPALIQSIEIKQLISQVAVPAEPMEEPDEQIMPPPVQPAKPMEERDEQIIPPPVRAKKRTAEDPAAKANQAQPDRRYNAIPIDDIDEQPDEPEDIEDPIPVPPKKRRPLMSWHVKPECVRYYNLHILGLAETHLTGNTGINIDGYTWFGLNRKEIHIRAKTGSGGVGILIRNDVRDEFNINIVEDNTDGIIWVKFEDKNFAHNCFYVCVIYLPPENSTRAVNIHEFFDILMTNIYTIPQGKPFYICGDWNSRCSDLPDSIEGIDKLPQRNVVDFQHNGYGNIFCDFLTDVNCCILNGRKTLHNDFTFVSTRGMSVVDYCVLPYEHLDNFNNFNVIRTSSIVEQINALGKYDLKKAMPDHSLLTWDFTLNFDSNCCINTQTRGTSETKKKYDTRNLPEDWLCQESTIAEIDNAICFLENSIADQSNIDNMYENFVKIVKTEMCNKLPAKNIVLSNGFNINKRRRCKKEWWNEELTLLWNEVCKAEKVWIKCKIKRNKQEFRHIFVNKRRIFDKAVQSSKRKYWYSLQEDLIKSCDNPKEFWRKIGKIGVGSERRSFIPMEVKLSDESVSCDKNVVLDKWKCEFSNMLNRNNHNNVEYIHSNENVYDDYLDSFISYEEVYNVLLSSKNGKSPGCDEITVELYKNQTALLALTRIFNICFDSGKIPALWSKGIITPIPKSSTADPRDPMAYRGITLAPVSYKLYCGVLNSRLTVKLDELNFLHDEQNGFRKGRNTIDHISTLTTVIETRKLRKLSTFVAFIDFKKAYDWINRDLLFGKLENLGKCQIMYLQNSSGAVIQDPFVVQTTVAFTKLALYCL